MDSPNYYCLYCGREVRPDRNGTWREITGWVQMRQGGGANGVSAQEATGRYACQNCMELVRRGISAEQGTLM
jgi:DNA-directed RNA polymerase subunit RPC12/RpoP